MAARGILNNNPGNLTRTPKLWPGEVALDKNTDKKFKQFVSMDYGLQALMRNLLSYFKSGNNTIMKILDKWDPKPDNNKPYIKAVSKATGIGPSQVIVPGKKELSGLTRGIVDFENGSNNITNDQISQAYDNLAKVYKPGAEKKAPGAKKVFVFAALASAALMMLNKD
jgi:hypothetical protein